MELAGTFDGEKYFTTIFLLLLLFCRMLYTPSMKMTDKKVPAKGRNMKQALDMGATVLEMNKAVFGLRRKVMGMLYDARKAMGTDMPRVKVRVVKFNSGCILGVARGLGKNNIEISEKCALWTEGQLRHTVYHELAHAWVGAEHDESCHLMGSCRPQNSKIQPKAELDKALRKYMR